METKNYCGEYATPGINVVEIKSQGILCQSYDIYFSDGEHDHDYQYDVW